METAIDLFRTDTAIDINLIDLALRFVVGLALSVAIVFHYNRHAQSLSERAHFSRIFPLILLTTLLVISVVKSSLALSLGLVGALSIVRFRTPIKEPEDLAYLFICIAAGVGMGAGVILATVMSVAFILTGATIFFRITQDKTSDPAYLSVSQTTDSESPGVEAMLEVVERHAGITPKLRRIDYLADSVDAQILLSIPDGSKAVSMLDELRKEWPKAEFTLIDQSRTPIP